MWNFNVVKWYPCYLLELPKPIKDNRLQSSTEKQTFKPTSRKLSCQNKFLIVLFQRYYQYWTDVCQNTIEISIYIIKLFHNMFYGFHGNRNHDQFKYYIHKNSRNENFTHTILEFLFLEKQVQLWQNVCNLEAWRG